MQYHTRIVIATLCLFLTACTFATTPAPAETEPTPTLAAPEIGPARVHTIEILLTASLPVQARVRVNGELAASCTTIDAVHQGLDVARNRLWVEITARRQPGDACAPGLVPFEEDVTLDVAGLLAGTYTVDVNGITDTFTLAVDNVPQNAPDGTPDTASLAPVERVTLQIAESFPVQVLAIVGGNLPDSCTTIDQITQSRDEATQRLRVEITTVRPADAVCTPALVPFEEMIPLDVVGLRAGTYTVDVNGTVVTFILERDNLLDTTPAPTLTTGETGAATPTAVPLPEDMELLGPLRLAGMDIHVTGTLPLRAEVVAWGNLPDSCTKIGPITQRRDVDARKLWVEIPLVRPKGAVCTAVIAPFKETIQLDLTGLPAGEYTVDVNGIPGSIVMGTANPAP